jgi:hypothetical protein
MRRVAMALAVATPALYAAACHTAKPAPPPEPVASASPAPTPDVSLEPVSPHPPYPVATAPDDAGPAEAAAPDPNALKHALEAKVFGGRANAEEVKELLAICIKQGDRSCIERCIAAVK